MTASDDLKNKQTENMKLNQTTIAAAALAGLFAVGTAANAAQTSTATTSSITGEKEKCTGKDGCKGKEKDKEKCSGKDKDKEKCTGKDGCKGKDKKEATIL